MTYSALTSLLIFGDDLRRIDREAIASGVAALQLENGRLLLGEHYKYLLN